MTATPVILRSQPGIKRDGTRFEGEVYVDGEWVRFQRGLPRKIAGFQNLTSTLLERIYGMTSYASGGFLYIHLGSATQLTQVKSSFAGVLSGQSNRTPAGFVGNVNNLWQFDVLNTTSSGNAASLVAHAAPNLMDISSSVETPIYFGNVSATTPLVATAMDPQSGGVVVLSPYLISYGNAGRVDVSAANDLTVANASAFVTGQKIVKGLPLRSSGGPAGLLWSLDSLVQMTFNQALISSGVPFDFNTIDGDISVLSSQGIIQHQGIYYWPGVDCWYMFNGVVREIPNNYNMNWFFDGLNFAQRQKVFAYKVPRYGEIWWCYPRGNATECTDAVILNVREGYWYDTKLPSSGRSAGIYAKVYNKPFMVDVDLTSTGYSLLQHETGVDAVMGTAVSALRSFFETSEFTVVTGEQPQNKGMRVSFVEADFVQRGPLTIQVVGQANARAPVQELGIQTITEAAADASEQIAPFKDSIRLMRFRVESNVAGGDYQMGQTLAHLEPYEGRQTS